MLEVCRGFIMTFLRQCKNVTCTVTCKQAPHEKREGTFKNEAQHVEYTGYDQKTGRLLYMATSTNFPRNHSIKFGKRFLLSRPKMTISTTLHDQHIYIFRHWIADFLTKKPAITSLKDELIPILVHQQFQSRREVCLQLRNSFGGSPYRVYVRMRRSKGPLVVRTLTTRDRDNTCSKAPPPCAPWKIQTQHVASMHRDHPTTREKGGGAMAKCGRTLRCCSANTPTSFKHTPHHKCPMVIRAKRLA